MVLGCSVLHNVFFPVSAMFVDLWQCWLFYLSSIQVYKQCRLSHLSSVQLSYLVLSVFLSPYLDIFFAVLINVYVVCAGAKEGLVE